MTHTFSILAASLLAAQGQEMPIVQVDHTPVVSTNMGSGSCCGGGTSQAWEWSGTTMSGTTMSGGLFQHSGGGLLGGLRNRLQGMFGGGGHQQPMMSGDCGCSSNIGGMGIIQEPMPVPMNSVVPPPPIQTGPPPKTLQAPLPKSPDIQAPTDPQSLTETQAVPQAMPSGPPQANPTTPTPPTTSMTPSPAPSGLPVPAPQGGNLNGIPSMPSN